MGENECELKSVKIGSWDQSYVTKMNQIRVKFVQRKADIPYPANLETLYEHIEL